MLKLWEGLHWKGYFASGEELTSGAPDAKEGIYFGEEYDLNSPQVQQKFAMHGKSSSHAYLSPSQTPVLFRNVEFLDSGICLFDYSIARAIPPTVTVTE